MINLKKGQIFQDVQVKFQRFQSISKIIDHVILRLHCMMPSCLQSWQEENHQVHEKLLSLIGKIGKETKAKSRVRGPVSVSSKMGSLTLTFKVILVIVTQNSRKIWFVCTIACNGFELESSNLCLWILLVGTENGGQWPWPSRCFSHFDSKFQEKAFNVTRLLI